MIARFPYFVILLFLLQVLLTLRVTNMPAPIIFLHCTILATTVAYFAVTVFAIPKLTKYTAVKFETLFGHSLLPFLQVTAADMWLVANVVHIGYPGAVVGLLIVLACLTLL